MFCYSSSRFCHRRRRRCRLRLRYFWSAMFVDISSFVDIVFMHFLSLTHFNFSCVNSHYFQSRFIIYSRIESGPCSRMSSVLGYFPNVQMIADQDKREFIRTVKFQPKSALLLKLRPELLIFYTCYRPI